MLRGRGVIEATRDGRTLLLDTHPSNAPPSPPPSSAQPPAIPAPPSPCAQGRTLRPRSSPESCSVTAVQERRHEDSSGRCASGSSPIPAEYTLGKATTAAGDGRLLAPLGGVLGWTGGPVATGNFARNFSDAPDASEATKWKRKCPVSGPVRGAVLRPAVAALPTLGEMCKRGVLVRATRRITCMSVVGVKFAKAATWCRNCGMVS